MATIQSTLSLNDRMSTTFSSITKAMHSTLSAMKAVKGEDMGKTFDKAQKDILNAEKSLKLFDKQLKHANNSMEDGKSKSNGFLSSLLRFSIVQKLFSMITGQLDSAISRFDTLNNFPKVMSNLGIDTQQSTAAINLLSEKLKGIPTTLDSAALAVQRLTSVNNNIGASTEMFLALNNAILAGGASSEIQASALEQISQSYSKGKPDMMEWRTLLMAMPAQLNQIAKAMGYASATDLGDSLRTGKESMNEFMKTIIRLNKEGVPGFKSFEEQARNATGGIKTSMANMKSAITRGIGSILTSVNNALEAGGFGSIGKQLSNFGSTMEKILTRIGAIIGQIIKLLTPVLKVIKQIYDFISTNWSWIGPVLLGIVAALAIYNTAMLVSAAATKILSFMLGLVTTKGLVLAIVIGAIAGILLYLWNTNDTVAYWMLFAWDSLQLGAMLLWLGVQTAFYSIVLAGLYMYQGILGVVLGMQTAFYMAKLGGLTLQLGFQGVCEGIVNAFIWMYNKVAELLNKLGASFDTMNYADFTSKTVDKIGNTMQDYVNSTAATLGAMDQVNGKIDEFKSKLKDTAYNGATNIQNKAAGFNESRQQRTNDRNKLAGGIGGAVSNAVSGVLDNNLDGLTGPDGAGGKAVKTTSKDDLISDEDIQLLLDVATRDYKLNYQQVTPQITLTFGDVRETADVDGILDEVATRLEEIYDADLEVAR